MEHKPTPGLRIIGGIDEAHRHNRGEIEAKEHRFHIRRPMPIEQMAQATRDAGMQAAINARLNGKPVHVRPSYFATLAADFRDVLSEVRGSPYSHALVAALTVIAWTALLVIPTLIGVGK